MTHSSEYIPTVPAALPLGEPPLWAILERRLIAAMDEAAEPLLKRYVREDGSILWPTTESFHSIDGLDDAYESFHNWPLYYILGGADRYRDHSLREYDAITAQFARYDSGHGHPMVVKEYEQGYDWMHQGEGYLFFYLLALADPRNRVNQARACRYAGFYLNEDPDARNYDPALRLVTSPHPGSMGPGWRNFGGPEGNPWGPADWKKYYGLPFQDVPGVRTLEDIADPAKAAAMGRVIRERMARGDVATNLAITSMVTQAYLYTGDDKYKRWVGEYVDTWLERAKHNNGILPDNVGLSGKIGEYTGGKWYGGYYGWTWPHGWHTLGAAVTAAAENAALLYRDPAYLDLARSQMEMLVQRAIEREGTLYVPFKYGDPGWYGYQYGRGVLREEGPGPQETRPILWRDGWFEFQPMDARFLAHVWYMSGSADDRERMVALRDGRARDWEQVLDLRTKDQGGHEQAWLAYLQGQYPAYPQEILQHNLMQVYRRLDFMYRDQQDPKTYGDWYLQARNPITAEGLVQLTLGAPLPIYNGGLLMARLRYYDAERRRPGLPPDVAALVEKVEAHRVVLRLANLSASQYRDVIIQAGAYGEHRFTTAAYQAPQDAPVRPVEYPGTVAVLAVEKQLAVNGPWLRVHLRPASQVALDLGMERLVSSPSLALPPHWEA